MQRAHHGGGPLAGAQTAGKQPVRSSNRDRTDLVLDLVVVDRQVTVVKVAHQRPPTIDGVVDRRGGDAGSITQSPDLNAGRRSAVTVGRRGFWSTFPKLQGGLTGNARQRQQKQDRPERAASVIYHNIHYAYLWDSQNPHQPLQSQPYPGSRILRANPAQLTRRSARPAIEPRTQSR